VGVGTTFDRIDERLSAWISAQPLFFVATAPLGADGHVNLSPKGPIGSLRVLDPHTVAYLDVIGSGAETIAHLRENGRIVMMICAFEGPPRILRLHGRGRVVIVVTLTRVADSCGFGVPLMHHERQRHHLPAWAASKLRSGGEEALTEYRRRNNRESIDGLPALDLPAPVD